MLAVGRRREKNLSDPAGVRTIGGRWFWQPTSLKERRQRKAEGLSASVPLGVAGSLAARKAWAVVSGHREAEDATAGTVGELLKLFYAGPIKTRPNGKARAADTVRQYGHCRPAVEKRFAAARYGKTEHEASTGQAIGTADVQRFIVEAGSLGKKYLAILTGSFDNAIRTGLTTYNPCDKVVAPDQPARTREPQEWEVECLRVLASPAMALMMEFEAITAWRIRDILTLSRGQLGPAGVKAVHKGGKRRIWEWSEEMRRIMREAESLPGASKFPASPIFPSESGRPYRYARFNEEWNALKAKANAELATGAIPLSIEDLHFHDLRSKAHDDAEDESRPGYDLLGNTPAVSKKHYRRRAEKVRPLR